MLKLENQGQKKCNNDHHTSMLYSRLLLDTITNFIFFSFFLSFFFFLFFFSSLSSDWIPWVYFKTIKRESPFSRFLCFNFWRRILHSFNYSDHAYIYSYNIYFSAKTLQDILPRYLTVTMEIIFLHDLDLYISFQVY